MRPTQIAREIDSDNNSLLEPTAPAFHRQTPWTTSVPERPFTPQPKLCSSLIQFAATRQKLGPIINKEEPSGAEQEITVKTGQDANWPFVLFKNRKGAAAGPPGEWSWACSRSQGKRGCLGANPWDHRWPLTPEGMGLGSGEMCLWKSGLPSELQAGQALPSPPPSNDLWGRVRSTHARPQGWA